MQEKTILYYAIKENAPYPFSIPLFKQTNLAVHRQAVGQIKTTLHLFPPFVSTVSHPSTLPI